MINCKNQLVKIPISKKAQLVKKPISKNTN